MSILNVEHLSHGFGDRAIFQDVSFRLLKGEHIGLVGANGEGKSTFFKIVTDRMMPDEGKIEWAKNVRVGYLDQHAELKKGMTIREVLSSAFSWLYEMEEKMNTICDQMGEASPEEMEQMMEELGTIQDLLTMHDFYIIDAKVEEVARALGLLELGLESDVTELPAHRLRWNRLFYHLFCRLPSPRQSADPHRLPEVSASRLSADPSHPLRLPALR